MAPRKYAPKLSWEQIKEVRRLWESTKELPVRDPNRYTAPKLAKMFKVSESCIRNFTGGWRRTQEHVYRFCKACCKKFICANPNTWHCSDLCRLFDKVEYKEDTECCIWAGCSLEYDGRGLTRVKSGKTVLVPRLVYTICLGPIPDGDGYHGVEVCHTCNNPACINPNHLYLDTHKGNMDYRCKTGRTANGKNRQFFSEAEKQEYWKNKRRLYQTSNV